ncbi:uncharacterized protein G2W53_031436 [Senna tora]|uniref:Uncharacterized protein n=1 Tax=Senna tora TaxID=362788 RepID=A0A834T982_9FABA|nr:uncharacterized protein G2W53_031436 [Senna tora]
MGTKKRFDWRRKGRIKVADERSALIRDCTCKRTKNVRVLKPIFGYPPRVSDKQEQIAMDRG